MARIAGVDIPGEKRLEISLTYIYGIGRTRSQEICPRHQPGHQRVRDLTDDEVARIRNHIEATFKVEATCAVRWRRTSSARWRSAAGRAWPPAHLPVRGQRTQTNARTRKGLEEDGRRQEEGEEVTP